jgi:hypothetical protein
MIAVCLFAAAVYPDGNSKMSVFARSALNFGRYFGLFSLSVLGNYLLFKENFHTILSACTAGYAVQHLTQRLSSMFDFFVPLGDDMLAPWGMILKVLLYFPIPYLVCYFVFARRVVEKGYKNERDKRLDVISIVVVFLCMVITRISDFGVRSAVSVLMEGSYSIICCILVLTLQFYLYRILRMNREWQTAKKLHEKERTEYKHWQESVDTINVKCHDLKHQIGSLRLGCSEKSIREIEDSIMIYESALKTGNEVVDIILFEKNVYCERNGIQFIYMIDGKALWFIEKEDLFSLFYNVIDNAIEGVEGLPDPQRRVIQLNVQRVADSLVIREENYYAGAVQVENGLPITTKADKENHGFGVKSIRMIAEKYGGNLLFSADDGIFTLNICIPLKTQDQ